MTIPGQTFTINDPGLGLTQPATNLPLFIRESTLGTHAVTTLATISNIPDAVTQLGQGPLSEAVCRTLATAGGPVRVMRLTGGVAAANGAVTPTRVSTSTGTITLGGTGPNDSYDADITIEADGTVGVGTFSYSLDGGLTRSEVITIPSGGVFTIPNTGIDATFVPGAGPLFFEDGDLFEWTSTAAHYNAANIGTAVTQLLLETLVWDYIIFTGQPTDSAAGAVLAAAIDGHMTTFANNFRFLRSMMMSGEDVAATTITSYAAFASTRVSVVFGDVNYSSAKPFAGWAQPSLPGVDVAAARATSALLSTDLKRVPGAGTGNGGPLLTVTAIEHNEFTQEAGLDDAKFLTFRTWQGRAGFFITQGRIMASAGSDFQFWQLGRVMDVGLTAVHLKQQDFIGIGVRTVASPVGAIDERDASRLETTVEREVRIKLTEPINAEGFGGHVTDIRYTIDRSNNVLSSQTIQSELAIQPLGYVSFIITQAGFVLTLDEEEVEEAAA